MRFTGGSTRIGTMLAEAAGLALDVALAALVFVLLLHPAPASRPQPSPPSAVHAPG